jgi:hypothetical protein
MNSLKELAEANTFESNSKETQFVNDIGDIYFPMDTRISFSEKNSVSAGIKVPSFTEDWDDDIIACSNNDFNDHFIKNNITTINFNKSIYLPTLLKQLVEDETIYGVIIQHEKYMINPFHPLIAFAISSGLMEYPDEGQLHIFEWSRYSQDFWKDERRKDVRERRVKFYEQSYTKLFGVFDHLVRTPVKEQHRVIIQPEVEDKLIDSPLLEDVDVKIGVDINQSTSTNGIYGLIIPTQLAISSIATPYYGLMFIDNPISGSRTGYNLSPMMSGNINQGFDDEIEDFHDLYNHAGSGNICTGNASPSNPVGWFTLSKININSMFGPNIISQNGLIEFVQTSKKIASLMWRDIEAEGLKEMEKEDVEE